MQLLQCLYVFILAIKASTGQYHKVGFVLAAALQKKTLNQAYFHYYLFIASLLGFLDTEYWRETKAKLWDAVSFKNEQIFGINLRCLYLKEI